MKLLDDVGGQEQGHAPVADRIGGVDEPADDEAPPYSGNMPQLRPGGTALDVRLGLGVAVRFLDALAGKEKHHCGDDRDDECRLPAKSRDQYECDPGGQDVTE
ncbi:Uncharacterised protein [Mycobacteroides abscessus subsp. abscessus]|nr:Uncharacterised protein [Mycobacteroides abscessus subsp. abscessus]